MTTQCVQVKLEIGHKATIRAKPTIEGFTHDWTVFVRGPEGSNIQNFVERVIFHLHESFPKPKRVVKEPPYQVSECGYAGFMLPIEVFFRNRDEPKKVLYEYDLFLQLDGAPISSARQEKLTFQNPTEDFRRKLITAGGVGVLGSEGSTLLNQHQKPSLHSSSTSNLGSSSHGSSSSSSSSKPPKQISEAIKAPKSSTSSTTSSSAVVTSVSSSSAPVAAPSVASHTTSGSSSNAKEIQRSVAAQLQPPTSFVDLFGQPIKTNRSRSPDVQKAKELHSKTSSGKSVKNSSSSSNKSTANNLGSSSSSSKDSDRLLNESKDNKGPLPPKEKSGNKRLPSPLPAVPGVAIKKRKGSASSSSGGNISTKSSSKESKEKKSDTKKCSTKEKKREKGKHGADPSSKASSEKRSTNDVIVKKERNGGTSKSHKRPRPPSPAPSNCSVSNELRPPFKASPKSPPAFHEPVEGGDASPSSSISFSSLPHGSRSSGPLGALMAELDDEDDGILSPLSSDPASPFPQPSSSHSEEQPDKETTHTTIKTRPPSPPLPPPPPPPPPPSITVEKKQKIKEEKVKKSSSSSNSSKKAEKRSSNSTDSASSKKRSKDKSVTPIVTVTAAADSTPITNNTANDTVLLAAIDQSSSIATTEEYIAELKDLQKRIMSIRDRGHLQQIVNVIEETGLYQVTSTTFDFDLCTLDHVTVKKLQTFLSATV